MKVIVSILIIIFSISVHAQDIIGKKDMKENREQDLMNFIKSDIDLYSHYKSGKKNLKTSKILVGSSLVFIVTGGLFLYDSTNYSGLNGLGAGFLGFLSLAISTALITIGTKQHVKGKRKIKDVMDYYDWREGYNDYEGGFNLEVTNNGVGLVYSF